MREALWQKKGEKKALNIVDTLWNVSLAKIVPWLSVTISVCKSSSFTEPSLRPSYFLYYTAFNIL